MNLLISNCDVWNLLKLWNYQFQTVMFFIYLNCEFINFALWLYCFYFFRHPRGWEMGYDHNWCSPVRGYSTLPYLHGLSGTIRQMLSYLSDVNLVRYTRLCHRLMVLLSIRAQRIIINGQTGKATKIKLTAVRETGVSRYHAVPNQAPLKILLNIYQYGNEGFKGPFNRAPIMPTGVAHSDSWC